MTRLELHHEDNLPASEAWILRPRQDTTTHAADGRDGVACPVPGCDHESHPTRSRRRHRRRAIFQHLSRVHGMSPREATESADQAVEGTSRGWPV